MSASNTVRCEDNVDSPPNLSERWAYEKAKLYDEWEGEDYEGSSIRSTVRAWSKVGICPEEYWPYEANKPGKPKPDAEIKAKGLPVEMYHRGSILNYGLQFFGRREENGKTGR